VSQRQPVFNAPAVVVALLGAFVAVHVVRTLLPDDVDNRLVDLLAFSGERLMPGASLPGGRVAAVTQFVTHIFVHGDWAHLGINCAWFLAFATPVARRIGTWRFLAFFLVCGIGGALLFLPLNPDAAMVGASGAISGLMGAALRFLFLPMNAGDADALAGDVHPPLLSLSRSLTDRRILIAIVGWTLINLLAARASQSILQERSIAWEAHLGGFFTGFLLFGLFDRPPAPREPAPPPLGDEAPPAASDRYRLDAPDIDRRINKR
jgi:membrane associated rhomboid family serine protease